VIQPHAAFMIVYTCEVLAPRWHPVCSRSSLRDAGVASSNPVTPTILVMKKP
jgi:hypothetical protein